MAAPTRHSTPQAPYGVPELGALAVRCGTHVPCSSAGQDRQTTEDLLWRSHIDQRDPQAREALILRHLPYAKAVAAGMYGEHAYHEAGFEDYVQWATLGLIEALDRYDPGRGARFSTYAYPRMRGAIRDGLKHISERQEQVDLHRRLMAERLAVAQREGRLEDSIDDDDLLLGEMAELSASLMLSFMLDDTGMLQGVNDTLPDRCYDAVIFRQERQRLNDLLAQLTPREQSVIRLHYFQGLISDDIAQALGITRGRVSQLHAQALARLRKLMTP